MIPCFFKRIFYGARQLWSAAACRRFESGSKLPHSISATVSCDESEPRRMPVLHVASDAIA